ARIARDLAEIAVVFVQCLPTDDDVEAAREGGQHELRGTRLTEPELDPMLIEHGDLAHSREERGSWTDDALRWPDDPRERRLHVLGRELGTVVKLHAAAEMERVARPVGQDVPLPREIRDDRLAVARVAPDEVVVHGPLGSEIGDGAGLVDIEVR